jgi:hypothetical protein
VPGAFRYVVPAGACGVEVDAVGGAGATPPESDFFGGTHQGAGGRGDEVRATIAAVPGEALEGVVAGRGIDGAGGVGGGGSTVVNAANQAAYGGGGGGATDIRRGQSLDDRLLVAGGGGGGSALGVVRVFHPEYGQGVLTPINGVAGGDAGQPGEGGRIELFPDGAWVGTPVPPDSDVPSSTGGGGATATAPGAGGVDHGRASNDGSAGMWGVGASTGAIGPGAGGGGRFGGGSGANAGGAAYLGDQAAAAASSTKGRTASAGGGGSDWVEPSALDVITVPGAGTGDGRITLTPVFDPRQCPGPPKGSTTTTSTTAPTTTPATPTSTNDPGAVASGTAVPATPLPGKASLTG